MTEIHNDYADLGTIKLHYAECGAENDELVIMLHGFPEFWFTWRKQLPVVGKEYHAVAPDMRGYNLSDRPEELADYKINHLIDDIVRLAKHFGKEKFFLASHDWGAAVAWSIAIARPDLVKGLMIFNGPHPYIFADLLQNNESQIAHSKYMSEFREEGAVARLSQDNCEWLWNWTFVKHYEQGLITDAEKAEYMKAWNQPGAIKAMLSYYRASPLRPNKDGKPLALNPDHFKVKVPTLVVWGEKDHALVPENLIGLEDFIEDLEVIRLPEVTHWVTHEDPERVSAEILRFTGEILRKTA